MASSSSSYNMAPPRANGSSYDVFLSFRGEDTRHSFTDHLYVALEQAGICTFRDSDDAERGEELKQEIERAIKSSDASIIVLSENYARSTWCLDELSLILDQRRDHNHFVLPLFYLVDPSDIGKHRGTFKIEANPSRRWTRKNVNKWRSALTEVVGVTGMRLFGSEAKFIKEVVDTIYNRLDRKQIYVPPNLTGIDARYKEIFNSWLKQSKDEFLVIYGMPGSGKSTLAQYIVYSYGKHYESNSIVEKIGSRCKKGEMAVLQEQLCNDISKHWDRSIHSVCQGTAQIEKLLEKTRALIVLDDVVKERQLEDLLGSGNINKESKIIITTDNDLSNWFISKSKRYREYEMKLLNDDESLKLFSLHAFRSQIPKDGYEDLAQKVVGYCEGNPLALEVLGSSLSQKNTMAAWKSELSSFGKDFNGDIDVVLKRSYNSLEYLEKELFLHIACFFVGEDMDYVVNILEPDYAAESKIKTLTKRCFLYVTPQKKLMMHRLLQQMGRSLVDRESRTLAKRSRVWRNKDSYEMLRRKKSSTKIEGLALDIKLLMKEEGFETGKLNELSSYSLQQMDKLKLLKLNYVELIGSYRDLSEDLRWLCWIGFSKSTIHTDLFMGKLVALDMSYSCLKEFEPPMVLGSLKILNLKDSHNLLEIRSIDQIPNLETLILWNCKSLFRVCRKIRNLKRLSLLNMTGCKNLCKREQVYTSVELNGSTSGGGNTQEPSFPFPHLLQRLFLDNCDLECTDYFPLSFNDQISLQYINLGGNGRLEVLPSYNCLKNLRVLDLRNCLGLKTLLCLPTTLAELYIDYCRSIKKITFESGRFTLQEFCYEGCFKLCEIEGLFKLLWVAELDETDLGHMIWVKEYQNYEVCLVGDNELTKGRSCDLQMLYEFNIMSTSLPDIKNPNLVPEYTSQSTSVSFDVPCCPISSSLRGLNVILRYKISGDDWAWFAKISVTNGDDLIYNPKVFGRPASGEACIWLSYWPIGNLLDVGNEVTVSIVVMSGLEVLECGASLVYTDDDIARETFENKLGWVETIGRDLSGFQLSKGSYYLCRRDFYKLMEVGRLTPGWLHSVVGDPIDDTEVRGWRMAGQPRQLYQSFTELKTVRCIIHCPETRSRDTNAESHHWNDNGNLPQTQSLTEGIKMGNESAFYNSSTIVLNKDGNVVNPMKTQKINGAVKMLPSGHTVSYNGGMMTQFSSASASSFSPSRYQPEGEYDPQFNVSGNSHGLVPISEVKNAVIPLNQVVVDTRDQEQEILLLRKHLADYSIKEAQIHNEKFALQKRIAYMRLAFDQQPQDLVDAASKALSYRQDIIEENIRLTYALQDAQEERSTFISSLLPLLAEYSLQPPVVDAQSIVSNIKVLFRHLQEKLIGIESKLKESQYQLEAKPDLEPDSGMYSPNVNKNDHSLGTNAHIDGDQYNSYPTSKNEETTNKQVTFSDPVSNNDDDLDGEGNRNEGNDGDQFANWNSKNPPYTTTLEDPNSYSPYLTPVLEEPGSSYSEAADDDPLPAVESLQISGDAFPGRELLASGYSLNGTTSCNYEWVRHMEDGSVNYIDGAKQPNYIVTADDVDTYLAIEVQPMDNRKRKGELVRVFANEHRKIVCDPEMHDHIRKALQTGYAEHRLSLWTGYLDIWEPVTLVIKKDGINIRGSGTPVKEKFSATTTVFVPCGNPVEFSVFGLGSVERRLRVEQESVAISSRDIIVLTMRYFIKRAVEKKKVKKKGLFF